MTRPGNHLLLLIFPLLLLPAAAGAMATRPAEQQKTDNAEALGPHGEPLLLQGPGRPLPAPVVPPADSDPLQRRTVPGELQQPAYDEGAPLRLAPPLQQRLIPPSENPDRRRPPAD